VSSPKGDSLLGGFALRIYQAWFEFRDHTGAFRRSDLSEGIARSRLHSDLVYLRTIWLECRNVYRRIALLRRYKPHRYGIPLRPLWAQLAHQHPRPCTCQQDHTRNSRLGPSNLPVATLVDFFLLSHLGVHPHSFVEGCRTEEGSIPCPEARCSDRNAGSGKMRMEPHTKNTHRDI
jgi:hypothetical protein